MMCAEASLLAVTIWGDNFEWHCEAGQQAVNLG